MCVFAEREILTEIECATGRALHNNVAGDRLALENRNISIFMTDSFFFFLRLREQKEGPRLVHRKRSSFVHSKSAVEI